MIYVKTHRNQYVSYAEYNIGESKSLQIKLEFSFPANLPQHLTPSLTTVNLYDSKYANLQLISSNAGDVQLPSSIINVNIPGEKNYHLFFQSNFLFVKPGEVEKDVLEKILKKCETKYIISGGNDGKKTFTLFDSVAISDDKRELFIFKQIELKK